jgi:hypothetical protein
MGKKTFVLLVGLLILAGLVMGYPAITQADNGEGNFIFINYIGQEINLDLDDVTYTIPGIDVAPDGGRLILQLDPGEHKFAANSPGIPVGSAGEFTLAPGQVVAKAARIEQTPLKVDNTGTVIAVPKDYVFVFDFDPFAVPVEPAPVVDVWQPEATTADQGSVVWVNYYGDSGLTIDLAGELYRVPPQVDGIPGRIQVDLAPGVYRYTASVPYGSINGEVSVTPGAVIGLNITADIPEPIEYDLGDEYEGPQPITLSLSQIDLASQVSVPAVTDTAPPALPETGGVVIVPLPAIAPAGLVVKNYAGDTLVFTINNQTFTIANNTEQMLDIPPGTYSYTASLPFMAATGMVDLSGGGLELSVAADVNRSVLNVFQN